MGFLDEVSAFGKGLQQKTKDMVDVTSNNSKISGLERQINAAYAELGAKVFAEKVNDLECPYQAELNKIRGIMAEIAKIQSENKAIEDAQVAAAQAAADAKAAKQAQILAASEAAEAINRNAAIEAGAKVCAKCGALVPVGNAFCTGCGTKVEE